MPGVPTNSQRSHAERLRVLRRSRTDAAGFTLLEILLVLSVLAVLIGITWPVLSRYIVRQVLSQNAQQVWEDISRARVWAIDSGQAYQVRYEPFGQRYIVLSYEQPPSAAAETAVEATPILSGTLSESCRFEPYQEETTVLAAELPMTTLLSQEWLMSFPNASELAQVPWSDPIIFYPDGSATNAQWSIADDGKRFVRISVRGLTGVVSLGSIEQAPERPGL